MRFFPLRKARRIKDLAEEESSEPEPLDGKGQGANERTVFCSCLGFTGHNNTDHGKGQGSNR